MPIKYKNESIKMNKPHSSLCVKLLLSSLFFYNQT